MFEKPSSLEDTIVLKGIVTALFYAFRRLLYRSGSQFFSQEIIEIIRSK